MGEHHHLVSSINYNTVWHPPCCISGLIYLFIRGPSGCSACSLCKHITHADFFPSLCCIGQKRHICRTDEWTEASWWLHKFQNIAAATVSSDSCLLVHQGPSVSSLSKQGKHDVLSPKSLQHQSITTALAKPVSQCTIGWYSAIFDQPLHQPIVLLANLIFNFFIFQIMHFWEVVFYLSKVC